MSDKFVFDLSLRNVHQLHPRVTTSFVEAG